MNAQTAAPAGPRAGFARGLTVVAREEFCRTLETRWLFGFTALFALLVLGVSYFGLAESREVGFQGFARVTLSLMNLALLIVPLTGLMLGVTSIAGGHETMSLLLAQPVARTQVLLGKFLGLAAALALAQALGFGGGGVIVALHGGAEQARGFLVLTLLSLALGWVTLSLAMGIAALWPDRLRATATALLAWLLMVIAYDLAVLGATALFSGVPLQSVLLPALILNPVDLVRVLTTLSIGSGALFGPTTAVLMRTMGTGGGIAIGVAALLVEGAVPLLVAAWVFRRRDW
jgi:Cu-processing system permease protein